MINAAHVILYSTDADTDRAFLRDKLGLPGVDAGGGWLILALPPAEVAVHPADRSSHELFLMCDDLEATIAELAQKDVEMARPVSEERWGRLSAIKLPSGAELGLYEPRHPVAYNLTQNT